MLFIDEANELSNLATNDQEVLMQLWFAYTALRMLMFFQTFRGFLRFIVKVSKQDRRLHVIFASSDSFFIQWLISGFGDKLILARFQDSVSLKSGD